MKEQYVRLVRVHQCEGFSAPCKRRNATHNRQVSNYSDDTLNFRWLCPDCQSEADKHWKRAWKEYYFEPSEERGMSIKEMREARK